MNYVWFSISKGGRFFFRTEKCNTMTAREVEQLVDTLSAKFPRSEGYRISLNEQPAGSTRVELDN